MCSRGLVIPLFTSQIKENHPVTITVPEMTRFLLAEVFVLPGLGGLAIPHAMIHGVPVIARIADGTE
jgi:hypothetical protein